MALIKPSLHETFGETPLAPESLRPEIELLRKSGVIKRPDGLEAHFVDTMMDVGLDPRSILSRIAAIMDSGESDGVRLSAAKLAAQFYMHPALVPQTAKSDRATPQITFMITTGAKGTEGSGETTVIDMKNVLMPQVVPEEEVLEASEVETNQDIKSW